MFMSHLNTAAIVVRLSFCCLLTYVVAYNMLLTTPRGSFCCQTDAKLCHDMMLCH